MEIRQTYRAIAQYLLDAVHMEVDWISSGGYELSQHIP